MKPADTIVLPLLLLTFLVTAQGIRLIPNSVSPSKQEITKETTQLGGGDKDVVLCNAGHCSGTGKKLVDTVERSPSTSKNARNEGSMEAKEKKHERNPFDSSSEDLSVKSPDSNSKSTEEKYPDIIDIAGMDYSSARKKPPIHN